MEDNPPFITTQRHGQGGFVACIMRWESRMDSYAIQARGMSIRRTRKQAVKDAENWALREQLEYRP